VGRDAKPGASSAPPKDVAGGTNPAAAFVLGLIPGVGAIYNGEFFKAAIHILIFGCFVQLTSFRATVALFSILAFGFYWYMPFEAYFSAKKRALKQQGIDLETPFDRLYQRLDGIRKKELWGGIALIGLGFLFLLENFNILRIDWIARLFWPAVLIGIGVWLLRRHQQRIAP
jgi:hypothetical protein